VPESVGGITYYRSAETAEMVGVSKQTIYRYLAEIGDVTRDENGDRIFTDSDIERLKNHKKLKVSRRLKRKEV
jgi:DNA-binding transcriptional MerR regulator